MRCFPGSCNLSIESVDIHLYRCDAVLHRLRAALLLVHDPRQCQQVDGNSRRDARWELGRFREHPPAGQGLIQVTAGSVHGRGRMVGPCLEALQLPG